ncbi:MAG: UPF0182 family protein, partial [Leptospiraceae bacterium]|nr:UPF0182 family protein [Leptospiraceae bacterium]
QTLARNRLVVDNVRLWDYRPILATFRQLQEIRQYYEFVDVDVDRYNVNGDTRQVLLAARELNLNDLPAESLTWESRHLQYTHGYGVAMSPTNVVTGEGLPELWIKDFPPQTTREGVVELTRPGIYYGELSDDYICVDTHLKEIDYPLEENFAETTYDGKGGIELGTGLRKLLIAWRFDTWKLLISEYIKTESRILFNRRLDQAVETLAPFLVYDDDPYIVVREDGTLAWMIDAYTISDRFPYSAHFKDEILFDNIPRDRLSTFADHYGMNYIRNSVKVVIDAYDGTVDYYVFDPEDPVLRAWSSFFPGLFKSMKEMPEDLRSHLRYPENLFMVQSAIYTDYHMDDPLALMRREDRWEIARELYSGNTQ